MIFDVDSGCTKLHPPPAHGLFLFVTIVMARPPGLLGRNYQIWSASSR